MSTRLRTARRHRDRGETLIEIVMTIMVVSIAVTALVSALASTTASAKAHRDLALADSAVRNAAEAVELAASGCATGAAVVAAFTWPPGFSHTVIVEGATALDSSASADALTLTCPAASTTSLVQISVHTSTGAANTTQLRVRTP